MKSLLHNCRGFTLIEIIASLVIVGLMATVAGFGIVQMAKAFVFAKDTTTLTQKNELAMTRLRMSLQNLTSIAEAESDTISIQRRNPEGELISESFRLNGQTLEVLNDSYDPDNFYALADNVAGLSLTYLDGRGDAWSTDGDMGDLARILISMTMQGPEGTTVTFADEILPVNVYVPDGYSGYTSPLGTTGTANASCFVATAAFKDGDSPAVTILRNFRDEYLLTWDGGRRFVAWYYKTGPALAEGLEGRPWAAALVKVFLLPLVAIAFLLLYFPFGLPMMAVAGWLIARLLMRHGPLAGLKSLAPSNRSGAILIGLIITMVVIAVLGGVMVSLLGSSGIGTVRFAHAQKAQYLAQSGLNYTLSKVVQHRDSDGNIQRDEFVNSLYLDNVFPVGNDQFKLDIEPYWFEESASRNSTASRLYAALPGGISMDHMPEGFGQGSSGGHLRIQRLQVPGVENVLFENASYTGYTVSNSYIRFNGITYDNPVATGAPVDNAPVYLAALVNGNQTIRPASYGAHSSSGLDITGNLAVLPKVQGVFTVTNANGVEVFLQYDYLNPDQGTLEGLHYPPGVPRVTTTINSGEYVTFNEFAKFTSTGTVSPNSNPVSRSITLFQPLRAMELYRTVEGEMTPDNVRSVIGAHAGATIDGATAIKVAETETVISAFTPEDVYMQESLGAVDWSNDEIEGLWGGSNHKLSYDLQTKIRFTDIEDDTSEPNPLNHPGNYMPGLSFRVKGPLGGQSGDYSYYGFSIMRGIQGRTEHTQGSGCGSTTYYTEDDDIPDSLYDDHGDNSGATDINCEGFEENTWNDVPPLDGIPYLILWQKDATGEAEGCGEYSPWERMAMVPLVDHEVVHVHYETVSVGGQNIDVVYEGDAANPGDNIEAWKVSDTYGLFKTYEVDGVAVLGQPGEEVVRDPDTRITDPADPDYDPIGKPVSGESGPFGYIMPPETTGQTAQTDKALYNYRIYPKEWITLLVRIYEFEPSCQPDYRVNAITAYFGDPNGSGSSFETISSTDMDRRPLPRGLVRWPDEGDFFTQVVWGRGLAAEEQGYTSKTINYSVLGCNNALIKIVEIGRDGHGDPTIVFSPTFTTDEYNFSTQDIPEFGAHTLGISANAETNEAVRETAYFDDFAWRFIQGTGAAVAFPGISAQ